MKLLGARIHLRRDVNNRVIGVDLSLISREKRCPGTIVSADIRGQKIAFFVENASDEIQRTTIWARRSVNDQPSGPIKLVRGDDFLSKDRVDFVKIDTEGSELRVLEGLAMNIETHRPLIFTEVEAKNVERFTAFVALHRYGVASKQKRYKTQANFLIVPNR